MSKAATGGVIVDYAVCSAKAGAVFCLAVGCGLVCDYGLNGWRDAPKECGSDFDVVSRMAIF